MLYFLFLIFICLAFFFCSTLSKACCHSSLNLLLLVNEPSILRTFDFFPVIFKRLPFSAFDHGGNIFQCLVKRLAIPFTPQFYLFFKPVQICNPPKISFLFPYPNTFSLICFRFLFCLGAIKHIVRFLKGIQDVFFRGIAPGKADTNRGNPDILLSPFVKLFVECADHVLHLPHVSGHDHAKLVPTEAITGANPSEG